MWPCVNQTSAEPACDKGNTRNAGCHRSHLLLFGTEHTTTLWVRKPDNPQAWHHSRARTTPGIPTCSHHPAVNHRSARKKKDAPTAVVPTRTAPRAIRDPAWHSTSTLSSRGARVFPHFYFPQRLRQVEGCASSECAPQLLADLLFALNCRRDSLRPKTSSGCRRPCDYQRRVPAVHDVREPGGASDSVHRQTVCAVRSYRQRHVRYTLVNCVRTTTPPPQTTTTQPPHNHHTTTTQPPHNYHTTTTQPPQPPQPPHSVAILAQGSDRFGDRLSCRFSLCLHVGG